MADPTHGCPGCGDLVAYTRLACPICWAALPAELRDKVTQAWTRARRNRSDGAAQRAHLVAVGEAARWYRERRSGATP